MADPKFIPNPTDSIELHAIHAMEEAAELQQALAKLARFGPFNYHPRDVSRETNIAAVHREFRDVEAAVERLNRRVDYPSVTRPLVGVAAIVLREVDGRRDVLMQLRQGAHGAGTWSVPGGHLEHGEQVIQCALRELEEETGIESRSVTHLKDGRSLEQVGFSNDFVDGLHYVTLFVRVPVRTDVFPMVRERDKCSAIGWYPTTDLPKPLFAPLMTAVARNFGECFR